MKNLKREISFLLSQTELKLLEEACFFDSRLDRCLAREKSEDGRYRLMFSYELLDELAGFIAASANHEKSERKQDELDKLCKKVEQLLKLSDGMSRSKGTQSQNKTLPALKYYLLDVWIENHDSHEKVLRKIKIAGTKTLYSFAKVIVQAFGFYFDHCFGFYTNIENYHESEVSYELFVDIGEEPMTEKTKGVKKTKIEQAFKKPGDKYLFLFDYGDSWHFIVELKSIENAVSWDLKPV